MRAVERALEGIRGRGCRFIWAGGEWREVLAGHGLRDGGDGGVVGEIEIDARKGDEERDGFHVCQNSRARASTLADASGARAFFSRDESRLAPLTEGRERISPPTTFS